MKKPVICYRLILILTFISYSYITLAQNNDLTADEIIKRIKKNVTTEWSTNTVDTFKAGDPSREVTGIACTFIATIDVLKRAKEKNCNLIITHEPTFYNHLDETDHLKNDPVYQAKLKYIKNNDLIIFRFHDHIHRTDPDGIVQGMLDKLDWNSNLISREPVILEFSEMYVGEMASDLKMAFDKSPIRVIGDPGMSFTKAAFAPGAPGYMAHVRLLQRNDVEVVIGGEVPEWESITYVRDAADLGMKKAMILTGHVNSEEAGMEYCSRWLKGFINEVPIYFIPAGDPFFSPR